MNSEIEMQFGRLMQRKEIGTSRVNTVDRLVTAALPISGLATR